MRRHVQERIRDGGLRRRCSVSNATAGSDGGLDVRAAHAALRILDAQNRTFMTESSRGRCTAWRAAHWKLTGRGLWAGTGNPGQVARVAAGNRGDLEAWYGGQTQNA